MTITQPLIWALGDDIPGHEAHTHGFVRAISHFASPQVYWISAQMRAGVARNVLRRAINANRQVPLWLLNSCYRMGELPNGVPDIVLSSGGKTSFLNAALARRFAASNFFYGTLRYLRADAFTGFATPFAADASPNNIVLPAPLVNIDIDNLSQQGAALRSDLKVGDAPLYCAMIGGDGSGYHYHDADWLSLGKAMGALAVRDGAKWLITTSRRTGANADKILQSAIDPAVIADAVWYSSAPRKVVAAYLGASQGALVTEDSMTMVGEAVAAGLPVLTIAPPDAMPDQGALKIIEPLAKGGAISRVNPRDDLQMGPRPPAHYGALAQEKALAVQLQRLLGAAKLA